MLIKYIGGRTHYKVSFNRKPYYFTKETGRILETKDQSLVNYIFSLDNRREFQVIEEIPKSEENKSEDQRVANTSVFVDSMDKNISKRKPGRSKKEKK